MAKTQVLKELQWLEWWCCKFPENYRIKHILKSCCFIDKHSLKSFDFLDGNAIVKESQNMSLKTFFEL